MNKILQIILIISSVVIAGCVSVPLPPPCNTTSIAIKPLTSSFKIFFGGKIPCNKPKKINKRVTI